MNAPLQTRYTHDLVLPTLLFASLGGMSWAVRGSSGYGAAAGCVFAGVLWGTAWWFIAREGGGEPRRRYASGWIVLAVTIGVGLSGARGWMQWPSFFEGKLQTDYAKGELVPISRVYGFVWLFIAGVPWAGIGACLLAWCGSLRDTRAWHWALRIALGIGGGLAAQWAFYDYPQVFWPLYDSIHERYADLEHNPNLRRLLNDSGSAMLHLGIYLGLLSYEVLRLDWKNVTLISTVGLVNGVGWSLLQNWKWAPNVWPGVDFNWWRCWESSGGVSIGVAYGLAYFLVNRPMNDRELIRVRARYSIAQPDFEFLIVFLGLTALAGLLLWEVASVLGTCYVAATACFGVFYVASRRRAYWSEPPPPNEAYGDPNIERWGLYVGLLFGLGLSIRSGLKGWCNIYVGREDYYSALLWQILGPIYLFVLVAICNWILLWPRQRGDQSNLFPHAAWLMAMVLVVQNFLAQLVTGPWTSHSERAFATYYAALMVVSGAILAYYAMLNRRAVA